MRQLGVRKLHVKELCVTKSCPRVVCEAGGQAGRRSVAEADGHGGEGTRKNKNTKM